MEMKQTRPIRIMLVDDHAMLRKGLATFLKSFDDLELAGEAGDGQAALELCEDLQPDVILMDLSMPGMGGAEATRKILNKHPNIKVIALTSFSEGHTIQEALASGAISYLLKNAKPDVLANAIRAAHRGQSTLAPEAAQYLVNHSREEQAEHEPLTAREKEVLFLMLGGLTNRQIAQELTVSPSTIKTHVSHILAKLNVSSRTEAVAYALKNSLKL